jgi:hypothetical protein
MGHPILSRILRKTVLAAFTLPKGAKLNADDFPKTAVPDLQRNISNSGHRKNLKGILLHLGNSPAQNSRGSVGVVEKLLTQRMTDPVSSPDLSPSDFLLFGMAKLLFKGNTASDLNELLSLITHCFNGIGEETLPNTLRNRRKRFH